MNNEIGRKTTSLILMTIMVAGGLTFAIPSTVPDAHAQTPNLYVSAVNPTFSNTFGGSQIVEVIVSDLQYDDDNDPRPPVTVADEDLDLLQANDGNWYGYFRVGDSDENVRDTKTASQNILNSFTPDTPNDADDYRGDPISTAPILSLDDINTEDTIDIVYNKGGSRQVVTLTYDDSTNNAINLDREIYPRDAHVHLEITDHVLNIDPTDVDVWTFELGESITYNRGTTGDDAPDVTIDADDLGCDDDCLFSITDDNNPDITSVEDNDLTTAANMITIEETGPNTGVFAATDGDDDSQIRITANAIRDVTATLTYDDTDVQIQHRFATATIDLDISDGTWNSGEPIDLTIVDRDRNTNSKDKEEIVLEIFDHVGNNAASENQAFTLTDRIDSMTNVTVTLYNSTVDSTSATAMANNATYILFDDRSSNITTHQIGGQPNPGVNATISDEESQLVVETGNFTTATAPESIVVWFGMTFNELLGNHTSANNTNFIGAHLLNVDVSSLGNSRLTLLATGNHTLNTNQTGGYQIDTNAPGGAQVPLVDLGSVEDRIRTFNATLLQEIITNNTLGNSQSALIITPEGAIAPNERYPITFDIFRLGSTSSGNTNFEITNNQVTRITLEETGDNTSTFTGTIEYTMVNQINIGDPDTYLNLNPTGNDVSFVTFTGLTGADARITYNDIDANGRPVPVSAQQDITTSTGAVSLNADRYSVSSNVVITLEDLDLNTDSGSSETYTVVTAANAGNDSHRIAFDISPGDPGNDRVVNGDSIGMLLEVSFDDDPWVSCTVGQQTATGLGDTGFTLQETGTATGIFTGSFAVPETFCEDEDDNGTIDDIDTTRGRDISVKYRDFRDSSGQTVTTGDSAAIGASTGSVSLDRTVYPVPFSDDATYRFPLLDDTRNTPSRLPVGQVTAYVQVNDPDYNVNPSGTDRIDQDDEGQVEVSITRSGNECIIGSAGGGVEPTNPAASNCPPIATFDDLVETSPESGIFEVEIPLDFNDGIPDNDCPNNISCILQGDILTVEYTDPADASGNTRTVTDSATFDLRNGALQTDKSVYVIGTDMIVTLIDPDLDLDSDTRETHDLRLIGWDSDADDTLLNNQAFDATPGSLRETGPSTGIFQVVIEVPRELDGDRLERGEEITLTYVDWGPSGADYVGDNDEEIERTVFTSNFGATIELDQAVYTWTDKVFITITAPDHNLNSNQVDEIGADPYPIRVATRTAELDPYTLVETGTDTGIFTGEVILTGFNYDADGDSNTGTNGNDVTGTGDRCDGDDCRGPTDGLLSTTEDNGLEVSFEFSEDEFVRASALIRWNIAEVQWLEASYPATSSGILRVIDSDMNLNPEAVDNFEVRAWSSSSPSGITLTVTETQPASGIFEGTVFFGLDVSSGGHRLNVQEGDTVTARYTDNTLPEPYSQGDSETITATTIIGTIVPPLERVGIESLRAVDATGTTLSTVSVDQQIQITSDLTNKQDKDQPFAYLVQIQDAEGVTVSLSWIDGSLTPNQSLSPSVSWTPTAPGTYTVTVFAWESVSTPTALSPQQQTTITVN